MLNAMREGAKSGFTKFLLLGFMALAVGGLVLMDIGGFFRGGVTPNAVARIGGNDLPLVTFDQTVRRVLANQGLDMQTAYRLGFIEQILRNEISNHLVRQAASDMGLAVNNQMVLKQINSLIEPLVTEQMDKKSALAAVLRNQNLSEQAFVTMIKGEMTSNLLRRALLLGASVPSAAQARDLYLYNNETRTIETIFLPHSGIKDIADPADEILLPFYQAGQERYAIPETRTFSLAILSQDALRETLDISDEELRSIYERDIETYKLPEQRTLAQAIVDDEATANAIAAAANAGKSLEEAVKEETGSAESFLGEETFEKGGLVKEIGEAAFTAEQGDVVGPIRTALGWHVLKLKEIIPPRTQSFENVRQDLKKEILNMRVADEMFATANRIDDMFAGGASLEEVVSTMNLGHQQYGPVDRQGATTDKKDGMKELGPDWAYVLETAFALNEGEVSPVFELADGRYAALRVDTIQPKTYKPFEEVKDELAKLWMQDQREVANKLRTEEALQALNTREKTLKEVAASLGAETRTHNLVRSESPAEPLNEPLKTLFFELPEGEYGFGPAEGGFILGHITGAELPDAEDISQDKLQPHRETIQRNEQSELTQMFLNKLYEDYNVKINAALLESTYGPAGEQY